MDTTLIRLETVAPRLGSREATRAAVAEGIAAEMFDEVVRLHQRRIYRVLLAIVRDPDLAGTLTQECFLRAYRKRASFRGEASIATWLVRIAVNLATDQRRNRRWAFWRRLLRDRRDADLTARAVQLADPQASPERALVAREQAAQVWAAAEALSNQQRTIFVLRFAEEMTLEEIARAMDLKIGTVKAHLFRATNAVRRKLEERGPNARTPER